MKNNDLSNRSAPCILIRIEDFLVKYKDKSIWDKIANVVVGKENRAEINESVVEAMYFIFRHTDMTVDLVIQKGLATEELRTLISYLPYGRIVEVSKPLQISVKLNRGDYIYYVDDDLERISIIGNKRCIRLDTLIHNIQGGYKFV